MARIRGVCREIERRLALLVVGSPALGAVRQQKSGDCRMAALGGDHQRRASAIVRRVDAGARVQQQRDRRQPVGVRHAIGMAGGPSSTRSGRCHSVRSGRRRPPGGPSRSPGCPSRPHRLSGSCRCCRLPSRRRRAPAVPRHSPHRRRRQPPPAASAPGPARPCIRVRAAARSARPPLPAGGVSMATNSAEDPATFCDDRFRAPRASSRVKCTDSRSSRAAWARGVLPNRSLASINAPPASSVAASCQCSHCRLAAKSSALDLRRPAGRSALLRGLRTRRPMSAHGRCSAPRRARCRCPRRHGSQHRESEHRSRQH